MSNKLSDFLLKRQNKTFFNEQEETAFFKKNKSVIPNGPTFKVYRKARKPFDIIRANIIIQAALNKKTIEEEVLKRKLLLKINQGSVGNLLSGVKQKAKELPSFVDENGIRIIIPFFPPHLNEVYSTRIDYIVRSPYKKLKNYFSDSTIDAFDYYGPKIYDSEFSSLIKIAHKNKLFAYYNYNSQTIYFVDEQGRLENSFALFDKNLVSPDKSNMIDRLKSVAKAYFDGDRESIIRALIDNKLISSKTIQEFVDEVDINKNDNGK